MGFGPEVWGEHWWKVLHLAAFVADINHDEFGKIQNFHDLVETYKTNLPCPECQGHFTQYVKDNPVPQTSGGLSNPSLLHWTVVLHNSVRERLGQTVTDPDIIVQSYQNGSPWEEPPDLASESSCPTCSICSKPNWKIVAGVCIGLCVILILVVILLFCQRRKRP